MAGAAGLLGAWVEQGGDAEEARLLRDEVAAIKASKRPRR